MGCLWESASGSIVSGVFLSSQHGKELQEIEGEFANRHSIRYLHKSYSFIHEAHGEYQIFLRTDSIDALENSIDALESSIAFMDIAYGKDTPCIVKVKKDIENILDILYMGQSISAKENIESYFGQLTDSAKKCMMSTEVILWEGIIQNFEKSKRDSDITKYFIIAQIGLLVLFCSLFHIYTSQGWM